MTDNNFIEAIAREIYGVSEPQQKTVSEPQQKTVEDLLLKFTDTLKPIDFPTLKTTGKIVFIEDGQPTGKQPKGN